MIVNVKNDKKTEYRNKKIHTIIYKSNKIVKSVNIILTIYSHTL